MKRETLEALRAARRERRGIALTTDLVTGRQSFAAADAAQSSRIVASEGGESFVHVFMPSPRLIVIGAVHIAQKLVALAQLAEFSVSVIDPRRAFATPERFPGIELLHDWPDKAIAALAPDLATAIVTLTHDPKFDDPALMAALPSAAFYVGALGSKKTHDKRRDRLRAAGLDEASLARLHAPVGLPIGAVSTGEIAVSVMAEIIAVRRNRKLQAVPS